MRVLWRTAVVLVVLVIVAAGAAILLTQHGEIAAIDAPPAFDDEAVTRGALLAAAGNCAVCHTREGGAELAGGRPLETPFGVVHATNITPDRDTGIGRWSLEAFTRAMRQGIDRAGNHLYPVFPYDHFTRVTDADMTDLYAWLMTRDPAQAEPAENDLAFPYSMRFLVAGWNLLYLDEGVYEPDPDRDAEWNRGAYLVEGLGHCGACHSPRDRFGGIVAEAAFAGGEAEGWHSPALDETSPAPIPWAVNPMVNYLIDGWDRDHGIAAGPMTPVVDSLALLPEDDVYAIAAYVASLREGAANGDGGDDDESPRDRAIAFAEARAFGFDGPPPSIAESIGDDPALRRGAETFERACANCHRAEAEAAPLALTTSVNAPDPANVILITLDGIDPPQGVPSRSMRGFANSLSDDELVALVAFLRAHFSRQPPWENLPAAVAAARARD